MKTIGVKEFRDNLSRILKRVEEGEVIRILRHGKNVVELRPINQSLEQKFLENLKEKDLLGGGAGKIGFIRSIKNRKPHMPISDIVTEDRR
ncbi:MAG: type II toxin-antitoxin system Phd/YefM family antitoxin [bacterium]